MQGILSFPLFFTVAVLCGMAISRGLTAAVIALVMTLALAVPQYMLIAVHLLPVVGPYADPRGAPGRLVGVERRLAAGPLWPWTVGTAWLTLGRDVCGGTEFCTSVFVRGACRILARLPHHGPGSQRRPLHYRLTVMQPTFTDKPSRR